MCSRLSLHVKPRVARAGARVCVYAHYPSPTCSAYAHAHGVLASLVWCRHVFKVTSPSESAQVLALIVVRTSLIYRYIRVD